MTGLSWLIVLVIAGLVVWVALSKDRLAVALRVRFIGAKRQMADAVDDAIARIDTAISQADANMVKAKRGLAKVKSQRRTLETEIGEARKQVADYRRKADRAAALGREDLARECLIRRKVAQGTVDKLVPQLEATKASETKIEQTVSVLEARKAELRDKRVEVQRRATTAKVVLSTAELMAGVDLDSGYTHVAAAEKIVTELEAQAGAMEEMAEVARADERLEEELAALSQPDIEEELATLMAKHASK